MAQNPQDTRAGGGGGGAGALDPSVDPSPISNLHIKSLQDLVKLSEQLPVNWEALPKMPFWSPVLGYDEKRYKAAVALEVLETRWRGQRTLTPDEVQIVAGLMGKAVVTMAYELPVLAAAAAVLERRGRATYRMPFYQPGPGFDPAVFPAARATLLTGAAAKAAWHTTRFALYTGATHWGLKLLFASYARAVKMATFDSDPHLADLRASIKTAAAARLAARRRDVENRRHGRGGPVPREAHGAGAPAAAAPLPPSPQQDDYDSMAATDDSATSDDGGADNGLPAGIVGSRSSRIPPPAAPPQPPQTQPWGSDGSDGLDDVGDDASPVAPPYQQRKGWHQSSAAGGSAWERVRAQAAGGGRGSTSGEHAQAHAWQRGRPTGTTIAGQARTGGRRRLRVRRDGRGQGAGQGAEGV